MWQTAAHWQQAGRVRANTRVQAGTSEAASALNWWHRTSTSTAGGAAAAVRGTWRWLSTPREAVRPRCPDVRHLSLASRQWFPRRIPDLVPVLQRLQGHGRTVHARAYHGKVRCYACNEIRLPVKEFGTDRTARDGHARVATCATPQQEQ